MNDEPAPTTPDREVVIRDAFRLVDTPPPVPAEPQPVEEPDEGVDTP